MRKRSYEQFLKALVSHLNKSRLSYAITGAAAASYYGVPRTTVDADFIIRVPSKDLNRFIKTLERMNLEVNRARVKSQLLTGYNIISLQDKRSPYKADFIVQQKGRIERRRGTMFRIMTYFQSPEPLILAKLRMVKATRPKERSLKDRDDIRAILTNTKVDRTRIVRRARQENTLELLREILRKQ